MRGVSSCLCAECGATTARHHEEAFVFFITGLYAFSQLEFCGATAVLFCNFAINHDGYNVPFALAVKKRQRHD